MWTEERRLRQSQKIHDWAPWRNSTGPKTSEGKQFAKAARINMISPLLIPNPKPKNKRFNCQI